MDKESLRRRKRCGRTEGRKTGKSLSKGKDGEERRGGRKCLGKWRQEQFQGKSGQIWEVKRRNYLETSWKTLESEGEETWMF